MSLLLWFFTATAGAQGVREAEGAWWAIYGDVRPGQPVAILALDQFLVRHGEVDSLRIDAVQALLSAHQRGDERRIARAYKVAGLPLSDLTWGKVDRSHARVNREPLRLRNVNVGRPFDALEDGYGQFAVQTGGSLGVDGIADVVGGTGMLGIQRDVFGMEGIVGFGVNIVEEGMLTNGERLTRVQGELITAVGGDGVLGFIGIGAGTPFGLHQSLQLQLTSDADGPWPLLALRLQTEQHLHDGFDFGIRASALVGFKFGETPD